MPSASPRTRASTRFTRPSPPATRFSPRSPPARENSARCRTSRNNGPSVSAPRRVRARRVAETGRIADRRLVATVAVHAMTTVDRVTTTAVHAMTTVVHATTTAVHATTLVAHVIRATSVTRHLVVDLRDAAGPDRDRPTMRRVVPVPGAHVRVVRVQVVHATVESPVPESPVARVHSTVTAGLPVATAADNVAPSALARRARAQSIVRDERHCPSKSSAGKTRPNRRELVSWRHRGRGTDGSDR